MSRNKLGIKRPVRKLRSLPDRELNKAPGKKKVTPPGARRKLKIPASVAKTCFTSIDEYFQNPAELNDLLIHNMSSQLERQGLNPTKYNVKKVAFAILQDFLINAGDWIDAADLSGLGVDGDVESEETDV